MGAEKVNPFSLAQTSNSRFSEKITSQKIRQGIRVGHHIKFWPPHMYTQMTISTHAEGGSVHNFYNNNTKHEHSKNVKKKMERKEAHHIWLGFFFKYPIS